MRAATVSSCAMDLIVTNAFLIISDADSKYRHRHSIHFTHHAQRAVQFNANTTYRHWFNFKVLIRGAIGHQAPYWRHHASLPALHVSSPHATRSHTPGRLPGLFHSPGHALLEQQAPNLRPAHPESSPRFRRGIKSGSTAAAAAAVTTDSRGCQLLSWVTSPGATAAKSEQTVGPYQSPSKV